MNTEEAKKLIADFKHKYSLDLNEFLIISDKLRSACGKVEQAWSGSFAGWHGRMYFRNFETPSLYDKFSGEWGGINGIPDGWEEKQAEEVREKIEKLVGNEFFLEEFERRIELLRKESETLRDELSIIFLELSLMEDKKEKELFDQIEIYSFEKGRKADFIKNGLPGAIMTRDLEAMRQGMLIPSWLYYKGVAIEAEYLSESINRFLVLANKALRQIEIKQKKNKES